MFRKSEGTGPSVVESTSALPKGYESDAMVAPVTALPEKIVYVYGPYGRIDQMLLKRGYRQKKPIDRPLPYYMYRGVAFGRKGDETSAAMGTAWPSDNNLKIVAYDRLKSMISDRASLGVTLAESAQSIDMIRTRSLQLARFAMLLKKANFIGAARVLGKSVHPPKNVSKKKSFANNYLEFHFGWAPLVGDIYSAVDVLQTPIKNIKVKGTAYGVVNDKYVTSVPYSPSWWRSSKLAVRYGCDIAVTNPNLWLANQLGLINPVGIAIELVPFSFVLDWFVNIQQFFSLGTDFLGLTQVNPYTTFYRHSNTTTRWNNYGWSSEIGRWEMTRTTSLETPTLGLRVLKLWGWRRAAAAVSLLTQQMSAKRLR